MQTEIIEYIIQGVRGFDMNTYYRAMKTRYPEWEVFIRETRPVEDEELALMKESWDEVKPIDIQEALGERNIEKRKALFSCIGPEKLFREMEPELLDTQTLKKTRKSWGEKNEEIMKDFDDTYELYRIPRKKLFPDVSNAANTVAFTSIDDVYAVRCWCTTTGREYWIFVSPEAAGIKRGSHVVNGQIVTEPNKHDAVAAIAWTFRVGYKAEHIEAIYRQGDCLVVKTTPEAKLMDDWSWYHLDKQTYIDKLVAES